MKHTLIALLLVFLAFGLAPGSLGESSAPGVAKQVRDDFIDVDRRILDMARDWPADKYDYKLRKEMRTFGAVLVHVASGNVYAAKVGRGEKAKWDELDPAQVSRQGLGGRAAGEVVCRLRSGDEGPS